MTDPGASAGSQLPEATGPSLPDSAGDPRTEEAANPPRAPADASSQRVSEELTVYGEAPGTGDSASGLEIVPAFQAGQPHGIARYLDSFADNLARAQATALASAIPKINFACVFPASGLQAAIARMTVLPDPGLLKVHLPAAPLAAGLSGPAIAGHFFPAVPDLGFHQVISTMANSWDHGLLGINRQLAEGAAALAVAPQQALIRSMADFTSSIRAASGSLAGFAAVSASAGLVDLLRSWRETAVTGLGLLRGLARAAYRAALRARAAVLNGEDGPVAWFIEAWLRMRATPERVEAVSAALLEEGWDVGVPEDPAYLLTDLRSRTARQARVLRPIWETRLNYQTIGSLDRTVTTGNGTLLAVADLVPDPQTTEDLALASECEEQRLRLVLSRLKPDELQVTHVYAQRSELTWAEAARLAGAADPAAAGERVRRKLKRLGAEHSRRLVQAGAS